jgi:hypothetical protein
MLINQMQQSIDDWTDVSVTMEEVEDEVLKLSVTPKHESIGIFSSTEISSEKRTRFVEEKNIANQACVTIQASDLPENYGAKSALDLIVALDISKSMQGKKLKDCISTLQAMLRPLGPKDRFGLITFGNEAKVMIPASFMTKENKESALKKIKSIHTNGCTNLSGGLTMAWQELLLVQSPNAVRSIFLLTDGVANVGVTKTTDLVELVHNAAQNYSAPVASPTFSLDRLIPESIALTNDKNAPVSLFCFGYGSDHNSSMLQAISEATPGGAYYFVKKEDDVASAFGDAMGGLLTVLAQSAVLKLVVPPIAAAKGVKILDVHHDEKIKRDDGSFTVSLGDFYAEESRDVLFDLELSNVSSDTAVPHVQVMLSYMDISNKKNTVAGPVECCIARPPHSEVSSSNLYVEAQWIRICTIRGMEEADKEAQNRQLEIAQRRLKLALEIIQNSAAYSKDNALMMALECDVQDVLKTFHSRTSYSSFGGHTIKNKSLSHKLQRCMTSNLGSGKSYQTSAKSSMSASMSLAEK